MTFEEKMEIRNKIKMRNKIGFAIFVISLVAGYFQYIPLSFAFMIILITMAIIMINNSFIDNENNTTRILILGGFLIFFVYHHYTNQMNLKINAKKISKLCYKYIAPNQEFFCEDIKSILLPPSEEPDDE